MPKIEVDQSMVYNLLCDRRKKDVDPVDFANMVKQYLQQTGISQRKLAKEIGVSHNTVQDWLLFSKVTKQEYQVFTEDLGYTKTQSYRLLRDYQSQSVSELLNTKALDNELRRCIFRFGKIQKRCPPISAKTKLLLLELQEVLRIIAIG